MLCDFKQYFIWTTGIFNKKPIISELIVDGKFLSAIFKIEPNFSHPIGNKSCNQRAFELRRMVAQNIEKNGFRQLGELPRTIARSEIK